MKSKPTKTLTAFKGSFKKSPSGEKGKPVGPNDRIEITVRIRRKKSIDKALEELERTGKIYTRDEYQNEFGLKNADIKKVKDFAASNGLSVSRISHSRRSIILKGSAKNITKAFCVKLNYYKTKDGHVFRGRSGNFKIPKSLEGIIVGVFGFDNRQQATPKYKILQSRSKGRQRSELYYNPNDLANIYSFPKADGNDQCIGIIEFGGGHITKDLEYYFKSIDMRMPVIKTVSVGHAKNNPGNEHDSEVMLDIEVAATIAPKAKIVVYYAQNSSRGFIDSITQAVHDNINKPSMISISWGSAELNWSKQTMKNFNEVCKAGALLGVTICVATGDSGSDDDIGDGKAHIDFPASCPFVLACGGTSLIVKEKKIMREIAWNKKADAATGGGISEFFSIPDYQKKSKLPSSVNSKRRNGRGIPDLAAHADADTGYRIYYQGNFHTIGGTSAVAPLMAGLIARINQLKNKPAGFINPIIYKSPAVFRDITEGDNITTTTNKGYKAGRGWDGSTGLGVVDGIKLLELL